jgi:hypothetical protein
MSGSRLGTLIGTAVMLGGLAASGSAALVTEVYTDRAAFDARLGVMRVVSFDDVEADSIDPAPFAADRYATDGIVITGEGGQFASQGFGFPESFPPNSGPNMYAPGPVENLFGGGNRTTVTFVASAMTAAVAGFGAVFIDPDLADVSGFAVFDSDDAILGSVRVPAADGGSIFRGIVTADDATGDPIPAIARVDIVNGTGWPAGQLNDGVPLDDFAFGLPALVPGATTTTVTGTSTTTTSTLPPCPPTPRNGCSRPVVSGASKLRVRNVVPDGRDLLRWTWARGAATRLDSFGDPTADTSYGLCIYGAGALVFGERIAADGVCGRKRCWKRTRSGFVYRNPALAPGGIRTLRLQAGGEGKARITLSGHGRPLALPSLPLVTPVTVQLLRDDGDTCWDVRYTVPKRNTARQLRTRAD